jgi:dienelactone hydrolase
VNEPALWLLGGRDQEIPLAASPAIPKRLKASGKDYTIKIYPEANHGLFDPRQPLRGRFRTRSPGSARTRCRKRRRPTAESKLPAALLNLLSGSFST